MKLRNSLDWPDHFLRRMVTWCCREIGMQSRICQRGVFRNSRSAWGGRARYLTRQITVCVGAAERFPADCGTHEKGEQFADRLECLVAVTAHELYHLAARYSADHRQRTRGQGGEFASSERATCREEMRLLRVFRGQRDALLAEWSAPPAERPAKPKQSVQEKRAAKAAADLERWQRKLKLAQTKCRKLKTRVAYYEKRQAAKTEPRQ